MKHILLSLLICSCTAHIYAKQLGKHVTFPQQLHIGQEFIYEGIPYTVKGFDQEKKGDYQKVTLFLESPISFGIELGKEMLVLTIKQGIDETTGVTFNAHLENHYHTYNWKAYALGLFLLKHLHLFSYATGVV